MYHFKRTEPPTAPESKCEPCLSGHSLLILKAPSTVWEMLAGSTWKVLKSQAGHEPKSHCPSPGASRLGLCPLPVYQLPHAHRPESSPGITEPPVLPTSRRGIGMKRCTLLSLVPKPRLHWFCVARRAWHRHVGQAHGSLATILKPCFTSQP